MKEGGGTNGLTYGTPAYRHCFLIVVHVGGTTGSVSSERTAEKIHGAGASVGNINCPSIAGSSIVVEIDEGKDDVGVGHIQPSTITTNISIFYHEV